MRHFINSLMHYFVYITIAVLIVSAVFLSIAKLDVTYTVLWKILFSGIITAIPTAVFLHFEPKTVKTARIYWIIHFLLTFVIGVWLLKLFGWWEINAASVAVTFGAVVFIYAFTATLHYHSDKKHIVLMNKELKKRFPSDEKESGQNK